MRSLRFAAVVAFGTMSAACWGAADDRAAVARRSYAISEFEADANDGVEQQGIWTADTPLDVGPPGGGGDPHTWGVCAITEIHGRFDDVNASARITVGTDGYYHLVAKGSGGNPSKPLARARCARLDEFSGLPDPLESSSSFHSVTTAGSAIDEVGVTVGGSESACLWAGFVGAIASTGEDIPTSTAQLQSDNGETKVRAIRGNGTEMTSSAWCTSYVGTGLNWKYIGQDVHLGEDSGANGEVPDAGDKSFCYLEGIDSSYPNDHRVDVSVTLEGNKWLWSASAEMGLHVNCLHLDQ